MKKIYLFMLMALTQVVLASCSSEDPFYTASENDAPRILNTDFPDTKNGQPGVLNTITRTTNFTFDVIVTPVDYTTVTWFIDGEQVFEGLSIDMPLLAGSHLLEIVANTTKGLSTSRTCIVNVLPADGDPTLATDAKSRWLTVGTTKTIACENATSVSRVFIGKEEASNVSYADGQLTFTVPSMAEGEYTVSIEDASGMRYGCGTFTVSSETYVDPGIKETTLWEGDQAIDWNADLLQITAEQMADIPIGAEIHIYYTTPEAEYHAMRITSPWWGDNPEDDYVCQFDITEETPNPFVFVYDEHCKSLLEERGAICVVGFGFNVQKVTAVEGVAPAENILWEGSVEINWGDSNALIAAEDLADVPVGATVRLYYEMADMTDGYHALRITTPWWGDNAEDQVVAQFDLTEETPNPFEFTYTEANKTIVDERGGMLIVGYGYKLTKVTVVE